VQEKKVRYSKMRMGMRQLAMMECGFCLQLMHSERQSSTELDVVLFGAAPYAVCPKCYQEVPKEHQTQSYKWRWTREKNRRNTESAVVITGEKTTGNVTVVEADLIVVE
jgi:hypothetical protein